MEIARKPMLHIMYTAVSAMILCILSGIAGTGMPILVFELFFLLYFTKYHDDRALLYLCACTVFQNMVLILCAGHLRARETTLIIILKEMLIYLNAAGYWIRERSRKLNKADLCFWGFVCYALLHMAVNNAAWKSGAASLRQFLIPFLCFYYGKGLEKRKGVEWDIRNYIIPLSVIACILGLFIYLFEPEKLWGVLGYQDYLRNKTGSLSTFSMENFYTYDLGLRLRRFVSIFADPLAFAHFIAIGVSWAYLDRKYIGRWIRLLFSVVTVLCLSKYHVVLLCCAIVLSVYFKSNSWRNKWIYQCMVVGMGVMVYAGLSVYTSGLAWNTSIGNHFNSLQSGLRDMTLFGNGVGSSGWNAAVLGSMEIAGGTYGESFFSTLSSQLGMVGVMLFYMFLIAIVIQNCRSYRMRKDKTVYLSILLVVSVTVETLVSASSISMLGSGLYFILAGMCGNDIVNVPRT